MAFSKDEQEKSGVSESPSKKPALVVVWDPCLIEADEYAALMAALANLTRLYGAGGIVRLRSPGFSAPVPAEVCP